MGGFALSSGRLPQRMDVHPTISLVKRNAFISRAEGGLICSLSSGLWNDASLVLPYLFCKVFGFPGFIIGHPLLLLPPLSLLQPMFVLRGLVDVPVLQGFGDVLPQPPGIASHETHLKIIPPHLPLQHLRPDHGVPPGFRPPLSLHRPQLLLGDGKFVCVDDFGVSAAVGELQRAVPLALSFAHDGVGGVVFDLCCHSV